MPIAPEYLHLVHQGPFPALLYGRASRDPRKKGRSVGDQLDTGRDLCDAHGWPIVEEFKDIDRSASRHARRARDDFEALIAAIEAKKGRILVAFEASRYYRDIEAYIRLRNACMANDVLLCYDGRVFDLSKREDRKATAQDALQAEDEAEGIRDRVLRSTRAQAKKGLPHGRLLYGYARRYDPDTGDLIEQYPHPEHAPTVLEIFERVAAGETEYSILQDLKKRGERTPGIPWDYYHLPSMLRNIGYKGRRVFQGEDFGEATWPALVPEELFDQVQEIVGDGSRNTVRDYAVKHLLSGIARCGECEDHPHLRVGKSRGYLVYGCSARFDSQMRKDKLDAYVEEGVLAWLASTAAVAAFQSDEQEKRADRARVRMTALQRQLDEAREMAATFKEDGVTPRLSLAALAMQEERLVPQIDAARVEAQAMDAPPLVRRLVGNPAAREIWDEELRIEQRRTVLRAVVNIRLNRARSRGVRTIEPGRVTLTYYGSPEFRAQPRYARGTGPAPVLPGQGTE
ncbi:recombinase family protein [Streptomyces caniscabiei]|uniref:Recombinase family protein n=1 Tax=Streptomyces caniscabiei TaxID=2746961 RepID=A0A927L008_9ACTN|nr:recombinase family protein [Streptomyces caniscabiei]MBD9723515.1 recombinase family protein [Streptomyces caniscabiei]MDX3510999.1 recombinase family protein [Streptomyces caniscabiei]MDX3721079.1 recombinase family protein [Streptomyces caniscabiei]WEO27086.1 recombinase family protein [Streptomyces caniscabiei]